jgi:hypothetical protein
MLEGVAKMHFCIHECVADAEYFPLQKYIFAQPPWLPPTLYGVEC